MFEDCKVELLEVFGSDLTVVNAARVSLGKHVDEFIETGSLAAYTRLCTLRMGPDAQKEIQDVARMVSEALEPKFPATWNVLIQESDH